MSSNQELGDVSAAEARGTATSGGPALPADGEEDAEALPPNWEKSWDETFQLYFYYNTETEESLWELPSR